MSDQDQGILAQMLEHQEMWDFDDPDRQKDIIEIILDAEVRVKEIPIKLKGAENSINETEQEIAQIKADAEIEIARIQADARVKIARIPYRWSIHLMWLALAITGMIWLIINSLGS